MSQIERLRRELVSARQPGMRHDRQRIRASMKKVGRDKRKGKA